MSERFPRIAGRHAYREILAHPASRRLFAAIGLARTAEWLTLTALLILSYQVSGQIAVVAALLLAQIAPRLLVLIAEPRLPRHRERGILLALALARIPLVGALCFIATPQDLWWAAGAVGGLSGLGALGDVFRTRLLQGQLPRRRLATAGALIGRLEQGSLVLGGLLTGLASAVGDVRFAFAWACLGLAGAWLCLAASGRPGEPAAAEADSRLVGIAGDMPRPAATLLLLLAGLLASALVAVSARLLLLQVVLHAVDSSGALYALLLCALGLGALAGPLSLPRLLGRLGVRRVVPAIVALLALNLVVLGSVDWLAVQAAVLFLTGLLLVTQDLVTAAASRRLLAGRSVAGFFRLLAGATCCGQAIALIVIAGLTQVWTLADVSLTLAAGSTLVLACFFLASRRENRWELRCAVRDRPVVR
jgi:hypothetical protein